MIGREAFGRCVLVLCSMIGRGGFGRCVMILRSVVGRADKQIVGVQVLQSPARLGNDGFDITLNESQRGSHGSNTSDKVLGTVVWLGISQGCFSSL